MSKPTANIELTRVLSHPLTRMETMVRPKARRPQQVGNRVPVAPTFLMTHWPRSTALRPHKMTLAQFVAMYHDQGDACAICRTKPDHPADLCIDHNHKTGQVRGLLCGSCNTALGLFKDSPDMLEVAMQYLEERGCYGPDALAEDA